MFPHEPPPPGTILWARFPSKDGGDVARPVLLVKSAVRPEGGIAVCVAAISGRLLCRSATDIAIKAPRSLKLMGLDPSMPVVLQAANQIYLAWTKANFPHPPAWIRRHSAAYQGGELILGFLPSTSLQRAADRLYNDAIDNPEADHPLPIPTEDAHTFIRRYRLWVERNIPGAAPPPI